MRDHDLQMRLSVNRRSLLEGLTKLSLAALGGVLTSCVKTPYTQANSLQSAKSRSSSAGERMPHHMKAGTQQGPTTPEMLRYFNRCGITHICGSPMDQGNKGYYSAEDLQKIKDMCLNEGIILAMISLPFLTSSHVDHEKRAGIVLGESPARDKDVDDICRTLEACAAVGVPAVKYNMSLLGVMRTGDEPGRGGASYSTYRLTEREKPQVLTRAGHVSEEVFWQRIHWFLNKVMDRAEQLKIRMACHPQDPGTPELGLHGIVNVLGTPAGLRKFLSLHPSPYHGLNLCLGTTAEMLANPKEQLAPLVDELCKTGRVFNIHFRNIRGHRDQFQEVFVDEGDIDMPEIARILARNGYDGMLMPDHVPHHPDDPKSMQAFAYAMGYIKGVLQSI